MQSKRARPRVGTDLVQTRDQRRELQLLPVLVPAQMRVCVHDDSIGGQQLTDLSHDRPKRTGGFHERILAGRRALAGPHDRAAIFVHVEVDSCAV